MATVDAWAAGIVDTCGVIVWDQDRPILVVPLPTLALAYTLRHRYGGTVKQLRHGARWTVRYPRDWSGLMVKMRRYLRGQQPTFDIVRRWLKGADPLDIEDLLRPVYDDYHPNVRP